MPAAHTPGDTPTDHNRIRLVGRLSAPPDVKALGSGDELVVLRVVVRRDDEPRVDSLPVVVGPPASRGARRKPSQPTRRAVALAGRLRTDDRVEVSGVLQRHFWAAADGRRSRLQVRASELRRDA